MRQRPRTLLALVVSLSILLVSCELEDDLQINADGSGTYKVKILVEKQFADGMSDIREKAERDGLRVLDEGETADRHFIVLGKDFDNVGELSDADNTFHMIVTDRGFLRREYRLSATVDPVIQNGFKRRFTIVMPAEVISASAGDVHGSRVTWDCATGGTLIIDAAGFHVALTRNQKIAAGAVIALGLVLFAATRRRRPKAAAQICLTCHGSIPGAARFCPACGATTPTSINPA